MCHNLPDTETFDRATKALVALAKVLPCRRMMVITIDEERAIDRNGRQIEIVPARKWLLNDGFATPDIK